MRNDDDDDNHVTSCPAPQQSSGDKPIRHLTAAAKSSLHQLAIGNVFDGHYQSAARKFKILAEASFPSLEMKVLYDFCAELIDAACYPGCPQSLAARVTDILSRFLTQEREKYSNFNSRNPGIGKIEFGPILLDLRVAASYWGRVIVQQRAVQIWEPLLGPDHPKIAVLRDYLNSIRRPLGVSVTTGSPECPATRVRISALVARLEIDQHSPLRGISDLLSLGDAPADKLLENFHALESSSVSGQQFRLEVARLRFGRSRALLGVYNSFICRFSEAEKAFEDSERLMGYETCMEIRLHRMLWYAEHKSRVQDWNSVDRLIRCAHEVFMANDTTSEFIIDHFPGRFKSLCSAFLMRVPIDKIINDAAADASAPEFLQATSSDLLPSMPGTPAIDPSSPPPADSVLSPQRLFPLTPKGAGSRIDIEVWRQFVHFKPAKP